MSMSSFSEFVAFVGAEDPSIADERLFAECAPEHEFPMEGEDWNNFVFRTFCRQWFPEQEASEALFFGRFRHAQVPVLVHLMKQEMLTESTVRLFSARALCGYGVWKRQFYAGGSRRHSHAAVRRSYFSFFSMVTRSMKQRLQC
jgi:hypothetical protein